MSLLSRKTRPFKINKQFQSIICLQNGMFFSFLYVLAQSFFNVLIWVKLSVYKNIDHWCEN